MMRGPARLALLITWLAAAAVSAQTPHADVQAGPGTIEGQLVHPSRPEAVGDVVVVLYAISADGSPGVRSTTSDAEGRFRFEGIASDPHTVYLVGARASDIPFGSRVSFAPGETVAKVEIELAETTDDTRAASVGKALLRFERGCTDLHVDHVQTLRNESEAVIYVPREQRGARAPLLEIALPGNAREFAIEPGDQGVEIIDQRARYWGPLYPGTQEVEFEYVIPVAPELALEIGFPNGASEVEVLTPPAGMELRGAALGRAAQIERDGRALLVRKAGALRPGATLVLTLALDDVEPKTTLRMSEAQLLLELDDAALEVREQYQIEVSGHASLAASAAGPLLCIPLPSNAQELRFSGSALAMGIERDASGALAVSGPIPAGASMLSLRYLVPVASNPVAFERRFETAVSRLSVLITDTGLVPESDRLHPLRPVRTEDRSYLHLEALAVEPGEVVALSLRRLPAGRELSSAAAAIGVLLAATAALVFLSAPLRGGRAEAEAAPVSRVALEREAVMGSLRDLDEDFDTGKVSAEDHASMRDELRARAVALLREEREKVSAEPSAPPIESIACAQCGARLQLEDRFCSQCGARRASSRATGAAAE